MTGQDMCAACGCRIDGYGLCDPCQSLNQAPPWPTGLVTVRDYPSLEIAEIWDGDRRIA